MLTVTVIGNASGTRYVTQDVDSYEKAYHGIRLIVAGIRHTDITNVGILDDDIYLVNRATDEMSESGFRFEIWED